MQSLYLTPCRERLFVNPQLEVTVKYASFAVSETQENMKLFSRNADSCPCTTCATLQQFIVVCSKKWRNAVTRDENFTSVWAFAPRAGRRTGLLESSGVGENPSTTQHPRAGGEDWKKVLQTVPRCSEHSVSQGTSSLCILRRKRVIEKWEQKPD